MLLRNGAEDVSLVQCLREHECVVVLWDVWSPEQASVSPGISSARCCFAFELWEPGSRNVFSRCLSLSLSLSTLTMRPQGYGVDLLPIVFRPDTWGLHSTRVSRNDAPAVFPPLHEQSVSQGFPPGRTFFTFGLLQAEDIKHSLIFYSLQTRLLKSIHTCMYLKAW